MGCGQIFGNISENNPPQNLCILNDQLLGLAVSLSMIIFNSIDEILMV